MLSGFFIIAKRPLFKKILRKKRKYSIKLTSFRKLNQSKMYHQSIKKSSINVSSIKINLCSFYYFSFFN